MLSLPMGPGVQSLVGELRSHKLRGTAQRAETEKQSSGKVFLTRHTFTAFLTEGNLKIQVIISIYKASYNWQTVLLIYFINPMSLLYLFYRWGKWRPHEVKSKFMKLVHEASSPTAGPGTVSFSDLSPHPLSRSPQFILSMSYLLTCTYSAHSSFFLPEGTLSWCDNLPVCVCVRPA